jgi:hypothetical protein
VNAFGMRMLSELKAQELDLIDFVLKILLNLPMKKLLFFPMFFMCFVSTPSWSETMDDLIVREKIYYKKFTSEPFTGDITEKLTKGSFKNGVMHGNWEMYHENGQLKRKVKLKNGVEDGLFEEYWDNGQLMYRGNYKEGKPDGPWVNYNEDGTVRKKFTGTFENGVKVSD